MRKPKGQRESRSGLRGSSTVPKPVVANVTKQIGMLHGSGFVPGNHRSQSQCIVDLTRCVDRFGNVLKKRWNMVPHSLEKTSDESCCETWMVTVLWMVSQNMLSIRMYGTGGNPVRQYGTACVSCHFVTRTGRTVAEQ